MTYDEWKLETPEDEEARHARISRNRSGWRDYRDADRCWNCKREWQPSKSDDMRCAYCDEHVCDEPYERDPDDARDEAMDREIDR